MNNQDQNIKKLIHDYIDGRLSNGKVDELWAELLQNPSMMDYMQTYAALKGSGHDILTELNKTQSQAENLSEARVFYLSDWRRFAAAAAVILFLGLAGLIVYDLIPPEPETLQPIAMIELDNTRSTQGLSGSDQLLQTAISHSIKGELGLALGTLDDIIATTEDVAVKHQAQVLRGVIFYNNSEFDRAISTFRIIADDNSVSPLIKEQAKWYMANAYMQLGQSAEALELMRGVIQLDGAYSRIANRYKTQLEQQLM